LSCAECNHLNQIYDVKLTCVSLSDHIIFRVQRQLSGHSEEEEEEPWPDHGSILNSTSSQSRSKHSFASSNILSVKTNEAIAEAAAAQEILAVLDEQEKETTELQRLEAEDKERLARFESEKLARQQAIQERRRKLDHLEEVKKLNAARAQAKVYDQAGNCGTLNLLNDVESAVEFKDPLFIPQSQPVIPPTLHASSPPFIPQSQPVITQALHASSPPFVPQFPPNTNQARSSALQPISQVPVTQPHMLQVQNSSDVTLISALAEAISASRLPTPEPAVFTGDPLKFNDWRLSFVTLIDRKNIPKNEKLYYLRQYLGGAAKKAVEGFFLLGTEEAYDSAWQLLEKRFGDPFIIGKSFRDKLHGWPKISSKDGSELREFAD